MYKTKMVSDTATQLINDKPTFRAHNQILVLRLKAGYGGHCTASLQTLLQTLGNLKIYVGHPSSVHNYLHVHAIPVLQTPVN